MEQGIIPNGTLVELWAGTFRARLGTVVGAREVMHEGQTVVAYAIEGNNARKWQIEALAADVTVVADEDDESDWVEAGEQACYGGQWTIHDPHTVEAQGAGINRGKWVRTRCPGKTVETVRDFRPGITTTEPTLTGAKRPLTRAEIESRGKKRK